MDNRAPWFNYCGAHLSNVFYSLLFKKLVIMKKRFDYNGDTLTIIVRTGVTTTNKLSLGYKLLFNKKEITYNSVSYIELFEDGVKRSQEEIQSEVIESIERVELYLKDKADKLKKTQFDSSFIKDLGYDQQVESYMQEAYRNLAIITGVNKEGKKEVHNVRVLDVVNYFDKYDERISEINKAEIFDYATQFNLTDLSILHSPLMDKGYYIKYFEN